MRTVLILLFCLIGLQSIRAQIIENVKSTFDGEKIIINYDLKAADVNQKFKITLFSSHDNYTQQLTLLTGDVGDNILPGKNHTVTWDVKNSVPPNFDDEIRIKVKASKVVPLEAVKTEAISKLLVVPLAHDSYKRGNTLELNWTGGNATDKVTIELMKGGVVTQKITEKTNEMQTYSWSLAKNLKTGKGYTIRVTSGKDHDGAVSQNFIIKPKVPLVMKVAIFAVVGAVVYFVAGSKSSSTVSDLPGPVKP